MNYPLMYRLREAQLETKVAQTTKSTKMLKHVEPCTAPLSSEIRKHLWFRGSGDPKIHRKRIPKQNDWDKDTEDYL